MKTGSMGHMGKLEHVLVRAATGFGYAARMKIAIIGGTGKEGRGLALRWARAGHEVAIGSRDAERARARAAELGGGIAGGDNAWAVERAEVALLTVPYAAHAETLRALVPSLAGKLLIDITV